MPFTRETKFVDGVQMWPCTNCGQWLPKESFYSCVQNKKWGIRSICKSCNSQKGLLWQHNHPERKRQLNRDWMKEYNKRPEVKEKERNRSKLRNRSLKQKCRYLLNEAVKEGRIIRPDVCPQCNSSTDVEAHHDDYFKPLEVKWMCPLCHAKYHREVLLND